MAVTAAHELVLATSDYEKEIRNFGPGLRVHADGSGPRIGMSRAAGTAGGRHEKDPGSRFRSCLRPVGDHVLPARLRIAPPALLTDAPRTAESLTATIVSAAV